MTVIKVDSANLQEAMKSEKFNKFVQKQADLILTEVKAVESLRLAIGDSMPGGIIWRICVYLPQGGTREEYFEGDLKDAVAQARDIVLDYGANAYAQIFDSNEKFRVEIKLGVDARTVTARSYDPMSYA